MADDVQVLRHIDWREVLPFTHLFRSFRIAIHPSKLFLGLLLIFSLYLGGRILDGIWPSGQLADPFEVRKYEAARWSHLDAAQIRELKPNAVGYGRATLMQRWDSPIAVAEHPASKQKRGVFDEFEAYETDQVSLLLQSALAGRWLGGMESAGDFTPLPSVVTAITNLLIVGPGWMLSFHPLYTVLFTILFLIAWALFGGAISRIAAVQVARDEKISLRDSITFSVNKVLSFICAPLIPLLIIGGGGLALSFGGLLLYLPWLGPIVVGGLLVLALIVGLVMTLASTAMIGGLNLMYPTIAVEGSDSFDAISRSFSYVFARPWRMIFYTLVSIVYGALCYLFVRWFIYVMLSLTHHFLGWWLVGRRGDDFAKMWPSPDIADLVYSPLWPTLHWSQKLGAGLMCFWTYLVISLLGAFLISFYFSSNTIIYYLMRREVDATEMDDVYLDESDDDLDASGMPKASGGPTVIPEPSVPAASTTAAAPTTPIVVGPISETVAPPADEVPAPETHIQSPPTPTQPPPSL